MKDRVEILAPAGSMECLKAAIAAGADAVYTGGALFGARAYAHNLTEEELLEAIDYVHLHGRRLYLTVNTLIKDREMEKQMYDYLLPYCICNVTFAYRWKSCSTSSGRTSDNCYTASSSHE